MKAAIYGGDHGDAGKASPRELASIAIQALGFVTLDGTLLQPQQLLSGMQASADGHELVYPNQFAELQSTKLMHRGNITLIFTKIC